MKLFNKKRKPLVVMVHGFGRNRSSEFDSLARFLESHGYRTLRFDIYDLDDPDDADSNEWIARCEARMQEAFRQSSEVILVGFSMGGVIASRLASVFQVKMLVLVAPAFRYLDFEKVARSITRSVTGKPKDEKPSSAQTRAFREVVASCKDAVSRVRCPVLMIHGTDDEVIDPASSHEAFAKIPTEHKRLIYIEGARHRLLYDGQLEETADAIILDFLEGKLMKL